MPTFLELAGAKVPDHLDGQSLSPFLTSQEVTDWRDDVFAEFHGYGINASLSTDGTHQIVEVRL